MSRLVSSSFTCATRSANADSAAYGCPFPDATRSASVISLSPETGPSKTAIFWSEGMSPSLERTRVRRPACLVSFSSLSTSSSFVSEWFRM